MKTIVVTGATRGLGLAITVQAINEGYKVLGVGRKLSIELSTLIEQNPERLVFAPLDLSRPSDIHEFVVQTVKQHGRPWGIVNNAALGYDGVLATQHDRDIATLIRVNIESPILLTKYFLRGMLIQKAGRIVNISSIIATTGFNGLSVYAATKSALIGFTRSLAREIGRAGITVNCVAPGYMETDMTIGLTGEKLQSIRRRCPLGHLATPVDVAHAVLYLLSERASSVTGTVLTVDAGSTA